VTPAGGSGEALRWKVRDHQGRDVCLFEGDWRHISVDREHIRGDEKTFEDDMRRSLGDALLCHQLPATWAYTAKWGYYACSTDPNYRDHVLMTSVRRTSGQCDVVTSARLMRQVHSAGGDSGLIELDRREGGTANNTPCGNPGGSKGLPPDQLDLLEGLKRQLEREQGSS
jgi:hypothetical protein